MHEWGDEWFEKYGDDLYSAMEFIRKNVKRYSLCDLYFKEKYGTVRYEYIGPPGSNQFKGLHYYLLLIFGYKTKTTKYGPYKTPRVCWVGSWLYFKWARLGKYVLTKAIKKAIKKWPDIKDEIIGDYDSECF